MDNEKEPVLDQDMINLRATNESTADLVESLQELSFSILDYVRDKDMEVYRSGFDAGKKSLAECAFALVRQSEAGTFKETGIANAVIDAINVRHKRISVENGMADKDAIGLSTRLQEIFNQQKTK